MQAKTKKIVDWSLAGLIALLFTGSAMSKFMASPETVEMAKGIGLSLDTFKMLGMVEILSALLFLFPRTGVAGTLLLAAYMGGAMAAHLTHGISLVGPAVIEAFIWIVAFVRFPELKNRLFGN